MLAAPLIIAALLGAPLSTRAVVPIDSPGIAVAAAPAAFNPQAVARAHQATVTVTPAVAGTLTVAVENEAGAVLATLASGVAVTPGLERRYTWDGGGLGDGAYGVRATVVDAQGAVSTAIAPVAVDTQPPQVAMPPLQPSATARGPVAARASTTDPSGLAMATLVVQSQTGVEVGTAPMAADPVGSSATRTWNLRLRGRLLLPGVYHLQTRVTDGAGNTGTSPTRLLRVERAVKARIIYSLPDAGARIGLSFDDCGDSAPMLRIIKAFRAAKARTTFFCNGVNIRDNADAMRAALAAGDTIGAHTWSHKELPSYPQGVQASEMRGDVDAWWSIAKAAPTPLLRPPYGLWNDATLRAAGQQGFAWIVLWNIDPSDYLNPSRAELVQKVLADARPGAIVVMHVNPNTAAAVPDLIRGVRAMGLEPASIDEMLGPAAYLSPASG